MLNDSIYLDVMKLLLALDLPGVLERIIETWDSDITQLVCRTSDDAWSICVHGADGDLPITPDQAATIIERCNLKEKVVFYG